MNQKIIKRINELIENYVSVDKNEFEGIPYIEYLRHKKYYFKKDGEEILKDLTTDILKEHKDLKATFSKKEILERVRLLIFDYKSQKKEATLANVDKEIVEDLLKIPLVKKEVFHKVWGMRISKSEPIKLGKFVFYNSSLHRSYLEKIVPKEICEDLDCDLWKHETWVSANTLCRSNDKAREIANGYFEQLQGVLRYLISFKGEYWDIGIFDYRGCSFDEEYVFSEDNAYGTRTRIEGAIDTVDFGSLMEELNPLSPTELIQAIGDLNANEMKKRIYMAIQMYGHAIYDYGKPISFLESMMAIESLLQMNTQQLVNQSISAQISEYSAFLLAKEVDKRISVEKKLKDFYAIRSKLAHGASLTVEKEKYEEVLYYTRMLISMFLVDENLKLMTKSEQLREYIQRLRYS